MGFKRVYYDKLVRTKVPERLSRKGMTVKIEPVSNQTASSKARIHMLARKLQEESNELGVAMVHHGKDEVLNEIADVVEVALSIASEFNVGIEGVVERVYGKRETHGPLLTRDGGVKLLWVDEPIILESKVLETAEAVRDQGPK